MKMCSQLTDGYLEGGLSHSLTYSFRDICKLGVEMILRGRGGLFLRLCLRKLTR